MPYSTLQDLIDRAGETEILEVADRDGDEEADAEVIAAAIAAADRRINANLGVRYQVPLSSTPEVVTGWSVSIARYVLHRDGPPDHVVRDWKDALAELKDAAAGRIAIPDLEGLAPKASTEGATIGEGSEPMFTREKLEGFL